MVCVYMYVMCVHSRALGDMGTEGFECQHADHDSFLEAKECPGSASLHFSEVPTRQWDICKDQSRGGTGRLGSFRYEIFCL